MKILTFIIVIFFSQKTISADWYYPAMSSSDITMGFGPPLYSNQSTFYWFTELFTAICIVEADFKDECYLSEVKENLEESKFWKILESEDKYKSFISSLSYYE